MNSINTHKQSYFIQKQISIINYHSSLEIIPWYVCYLNTFSFANIRWSNVTIYWTLSHSLRITPVTLACKQALQKNYLRKTKTCKVKFLRLSFLIKMIKVLLMGKKVVKTYCYYNFLWRHKKLLASFLLYWQ